MEISGSKEMTSIVKLLTGWSLGAVNQRKFKRIARPTYMPLSIDAWGDKGNVFVAVRHYCIREDNLMTGPNILFVFLDGELLPLNFSNDFWGYAIQFARVTDNNIEITNCTAYSEALEFARSWAASLYLQGFCKAEGKAKD